MHDLGRFFGGEERVRDLDSFLTKEARGLESGMEYEFGEIKLKISFQHNFHSKMDEKAMVLMHVRATGWGGGANAPPLGRCEGAGALGQVVHNSFHSWEAKVLKLQHLRLLLPWTAGAA